MTNDAERLARIAAMSDAEVRSAYLATSGEPGDPEADALSDEIERREIDV